MGDIEQAISAAWEKVGPRLRSDPAELRRRVARWPRMLAKHWPREWCYAIRAGDTRINEAIACIVPERARYGHLDGGRYYEHEVTFDAAALVRLCGLVAIKSGTPLAEVSDLLGRTPNDLVPARLNGTLKARHIPPTGGRGKPCPLLWSEHDLDPSAQGLRPPEAIWGETAVARCPSLRMHDDGICEQALRRVPHYVARGPGVEDADALHPEHPRVDRLPRKAQRLPPPEPDHVWYKWKGDEYLGYDWRRPGAKAAYERHEREKALARDGARRRYAAGKGKGRIARGSLVFRGWRWICPNCAERVHAIYYRAPAVIAACIDDALVAQLKAAAQDVKLVNGFACGRCHHVKFCSMVQKDMWNDVITFLSGGLLYGSEVQRPAWVSKKRKRAYHPRIARPAPRRAMVQELLLQGLTFRQIATTLRMSYSKAQGHANRIYAQHGVRGQGRGALAAALGVELPPGTITGPRGKRVGCEGAAQL